MGYFFHYMSILSAMPDYLADTKKSFNESC